MGGQGEKEGDEGWEGGGEGRGGAGRAGEGRKGEGMREKRGRTEGEERNLGKIGRKRKRKLSARAKHTPLEMEGETRGLLGEVRGGRGERPTPQFLRSPRVQSCDVAKLCGCLRFILSVLRVFQNPTKCL